MPRTSRRYQWASEAGFHLMDLGHDREEADKGPA